MVKVNLPDTYLYAGKIYHPGEQDIPDALVLSLRERGILAPDVQTGAEAEGRPSASLPAGAIPGYFIPAADMVPTQTGGAFSPTDIRLGRGAVPTPNPPGVVPGDPVQRPAVSPGPVTPASAVERQTSDPASGMPAPVVHTAEGEPITPGEAERRAAEDDAEDSDPGDDGAEDDGEGDDESAGPASEAPAEAAQPNRRPSRVASRPRASAE